jgi:hypothetical protein
MAAVVKEAGAGFVMVTTGTLADAVVNVTALAPAAVALARPAGTVLPWRCVGLDDAEDRLATMGTGERDDVPPVHGALTP